MFIYFPSGSWLAVLPPDDGRFNLVAGGASATVATTPDERQALHHLAQAVALCPGVSATLRLSGAGTIALHRGPAAGSITVTDEEQVAAGVCSVANLQELADGTALA